MRTFRVQLSSPIRLAPNAAFEPFMDSARVEGTKHLRHFGDPGRLRSTNLSLITPTSLPCVFRPIDQDDHNCQEKPLATLQRTRTRSRRSRPFSGVVAMILRELTHPGITTTFSGIHVACEKQLDTVGGTLILGVVRLRFRGCSLIASSGPSINDMPWKMVASALME